MTWIDKLREVLPNSAYVKDIDTTMAYFCPRKFFGGNAPDYGKCNSVTCKACWNSEAEVEK